ncbi:MAG: hypothetical protein ACREJ5_17375 [Geminicoccaceae bacterium]
MTREVNRRQLATIWPKLTRVETKLADMDAMGIDVQVVSPSPFQCAYWTEPDLGLRSPGPSTTASPPWSTARSA